MKIYKVYKGKIVSTNVRMTAKMVIFELREPAFRYLINDYKSNVSFTPQEAILAKKNSLLSSIGMLKDRLKEKTDELDRLTKMVHI